MYLTASNLVHYLVGRGLVTSDSVIDGDCSVIEAGRRNRNFKLVREQGPGLFIKQVSNASNPEAVATLQREAAFYKVARSRPAYAPLARLAPKFVDYDPSHCSLIVELMPRAENLNEYHHRVEAFPDQVGNMIGRGLGWYHSQAARILSEPVDDAIFPRQIPWILNLDPNTLYPLTHFAAIGSVMIAAMRQHPVLLQSLLTFRYEWLFDSVIHGDMKWDNLLIFRPNEDGDPDFSIVDWEMVDLGDASWDVGSIFASYLIYWLLTMSINPVPQSPSDRPPTSDTLRRTRPALGAFWRTYAAARALSVEATGQYLMRCMHFCAARLVLAAFEYLYSASQMTPQILHMLQVSENIFLDPRKAASDLLGG
jgi:phosphotransferase family enzyme